MRRGMACVARRIPRCTPDRAGRTCAGRAWRTAQPRSSCSSKSAESARSQHVATVIHVALPHSPVERERPEHCLQLCVAVDHVPWYLRTEQLLHRTQPSPSQASPTQATAHRRGAKGPLRGSVDLVPCMRYVASALARADTQANHEGGRPGARRMPKPQLPCAPKLFGACDGCRGAVCLKRMPRTSCPSTHARRT